MRQAACDESQRGGNSARAMAEELFKLRDNKNSVFLIIPFDLHQKDQEKMTPTPSEN